MYQQELIEKIKTRIQELKDKHHLDPWGNARRELWRVIQILQQPKKESYSNKSCLRCWMEYKEVKKEWSYWCQARWTSYPRHLWK